MKPSQEFFCFPVIMYDSLSFKSAIKEETKMEEDYNIALEQHVPIDYVVGEYCTRIEEIEGWSDIYTREMTIEDVKEQGFNATEIYVKNDAPLVCPLKRKEFEKLYDKFIMSHLEEEEEPPKKKNFFQRLFS